MEGVGEMRGWGGIVSLGKYNWSKCTHLKTISQISQREEGGGEVGDGGGGVEREGGGWLGRLGRTCSVIVRGSLLYLM